MSLTPLRAAAQSAPRPAGGMLPTLQRGVPGPGTRCAFPFVVDASAQNLAYPDPNSTYWAMPFALAGDETLVLRGSYPSARFMAVTLYDASGDILGQLSDFAIAPEPGSANPYAEADPPPGTGRSWRVAVVPAGSDDASANVLQLGPGQRSGWLLYRVYLGNPPGDLAGGAPLPTVEWLRGTKLVRSLPPCSRFLPGTAIVTLLRLTLPEPVDVTVAPDLVRIANDGGLFVNAANAYLTAFADAAPGRILVVRGALPTAPDTEAGDSVVGPFDLRYLSITSNLNEKPYPVVDGVYDAELPLDAAGYYTVVVARGEDAPGNADAVGAVVLEWGDGASQAVIVRNMLPASDFPFAVQDVTPSAYGQPSDAAQVMGGYYPVVVPCTTALFEASGAAGCFAAAGVAYPGG